MNTACGILVIGDELLNGAQADSNSPHMSRFLLPFGFRTKMLQTCGDEIPEIIEALNRFPKELGLIITSGGLGNTRDDCTKQALQQWSNLTTFEQINNRVGRAPGLVLKHQNHLIVALPGVPHEFLSFMNDELVDLLSQHFNCQSKFAFSTLNVIGLKENEAETLLAEVGKPFNNPRVGLSVKRGHLHIHLLAEAPTTKEVKTQLSRKEEEITSLLHPHVFGKNEEGIEHNVAQLLIDKKLSLSVAESCTGGLISDSLTNIPGASKFFTRGFVTYSVESKINDLGITKELIDKYGVISEEVARSMAENMRRIAQSDYAIAVTGNAGPLTDNNSHIVGLVHMAISSKNTCVHQKQLFTGNRIDVKLKATKTCFNILREELIKHPFKQHL